MDDELGSPILLSVSHDGNGCPVFLLPANELDNDYSIVDDERTSHIHCKELCLKGGASRSGVFGPWKLRRFGDFLAKACCSNS